MTIRRLIIPAPAGGGPVTHTTTGVLSGQGTSITGTAAYIAIHSTSGVLQGASGGGLAGSAARFRAMASTGALAGSGASISGTAARSAVGVHDAGGALQATGASIAGTAAHIAIHGTSGSLQGPGAIIAGLAAGPIVVTNTYGGGGGTGGNKGWDKAEWARKKEFDESIAGSLKEALTPAERLEVAQEIAPEASPEKLQKIAETLTPKVSKAVDLAPPKSSAAVEPDEDEERSVELLLEEDYAGLHLLLPILQKALRSL